MVYSLEPYLHPVTFKPTRLFGGESRNPTDLY
ncbi:hypothetical protein [Citrobacter phage Tr1]|nr:hypothetical protein [Citrobacter phage Tr1]